VGGLLLPVGEDVGGVDVVGSLVGALDVGADVERVVGGGDAVVGALDGGADVVRVVGSGGGAVVGVCPTSGGSPVTYAGGGKSSIGRPTRSAFITADHVAVG
jgi:hypothetical protein